MARTALNTSDVKIEQKAPLVDGQDRGGEIVEADRSLLDGDYAERLAFMEEPVTIEIVPSGGDNPPTHYPVWVNGRGGEVLLGGQWVTMVYLPVGQPLTLKRKYVGVLAAAKADAVKTDVLDRHAENPRNIVHRTTSAACNFTILRDANPRGPAWLAELRRRQF